MALPTMLLPGELREMIARARAAGDLVSEAQYLCALADCYKTGDTHRYFDYLMEAATIYGMNGLRDEAAYLYRTISHGYRYYVRDLASAITYMRMACDIAESQGMRAYLDLLLIRLLQHQTT
jgi:hypothetical protein